MCVFMNFQKSVTELPEYRILTLSTGGWAEIVFSYNHEIIGVTKGRNIIYAQQPRHVCIVILLLLPIYYFYQFVS